MKAEDLRIGFFYKAAIEFNGSAEASIDFIEDRIFKMTKENLILILQLNLESFIHPVETQNL